MKEVNSAITLATKLDLPPIDQVGFVVPDIKKSIQDYTPLFGAFTVMEAEIEGAVYRGEQHDCKLILAFGKSGTLEIELIEITSGNSPHKEFIDQGRSGLHHVRYRVADIDSKIAAVKEIGYASIWYKRFSEEIAFCYLEKKGDPLIIEFLQML